MIYIMLALAITTQHNDTGCDVGTVSEEIVATITSRHISTIVNKGGTFGKLTPNDDMLTYFFGSNFDCKSRSVCSFLSMENLHFEVFKLYHDGSEYGWIAHKLTAMEWQDLQAGLLDIKDYWLDDYVETVIHCKNSAWSFGTPFFYYGTRLPGKSGDYGR